MRERDDPIGPDRMEGGTGGKEKETKEGKKKKKKRLRMGPLVCAGGGGRGAIHGYGWVDYTCRWYYYT